MVFLSALAQVLPVLLLILVGVALRRLNFVRPETIADFKKLIVNVTLPALLLLAFAQVTIAPQYVVIAVSVFAACVLALWLGHLVRPVLRLRSPYVPALMTGFEAGMMGYAIYTAVYGAANVFKFAIVDLGQVTFVFFVLVPMLERLATGGKPFRETVLNFFKTPVILAILGGLVLGQTGLYQALASFPVSNSFLIALTLLGALTTPLVTIVLGYELQLRAGALSKPVRAVLARLVWWVPVALLFDYFVIRQWLQLDLAFQAAVLTMALLPPPFVIPLFMPNASEDDVNLVVNSLTLATLVTLVAYSFVPVLFPA